MQMDRSVALQYSGSALPASSGMGILLEFEVGAIDCGAGLDPLSQYQGTTPLSKFSCLVALFFETLRRFFSVLHRYQHVSLM